MSRLPALGSRGEGWVAIQFVLFALIAIAGLLIPGAPGPGDTATVREAAGVILIAAGGLVAVLATLVLRQGGALTAVPHPLPGADLVAHGPYRFIRHPIYAAIVVAATGWAILRTSIPALVATLVLLAFFDLKRRREEAWLLAHHAGYEAYMARTRALIPGVY